MSRPTHLLADDLGFAIGRDARGVYLCSLETSKIVAWGLTDSEIRLWLTAFKNGSVEKTLAALKEAAILVERLDTLKSKSANVKN
jgi:hypothetical protein